MSIVAIMRLEGLENEYTAMVEEALQVGGCAVLCCAVLRCAGH